MSCFSQTQEAGRKGDRELQQQSMGFNTCLTGNTVQWSRFHSIKMTFQRSFWGGWESLEGNRGQEEDAESDAITGTCVTADSETCI